MAQEEVRYDRSKMNQTYCNFLRIQSSPDEVLFDFGIRKVEDPNEIEVLQRIITSHAHAARMRDALIRHLEQIQAARGAEKDRGEKDDD